jgi:hypothetical protein
MTTPITQAVQHQAIPVGARRDWCCGTPITGPHVAGCAYEPRPDDPIDYAGLVTEAVSEPPPMPPQAPAAAQPRSYGIRKKGEDDLELPSGSFVRYRKLSPGQVLELNLVEVLDGFTPELLADAQSGDEDQARQAFMKAVSNPETNAKIFGPTDRVVAASVLIPTVVLEGPTTDTQVNVADIDLGDKLVIFSAAVGEQLGALKSVRNESSAGV